VTASAQLRYRSEFNASVALRRENSTNTHTQVVCRVVKSLASSGEIRLRWHLFLKHKDTDKIAKKKKNIGT